MTHPFRGNAVRAAAAVATLLSVAYFVWWGCFAAVLPVPAPCGGLCCADCQCCGGDDGSHFCSLPGEGCPRVSCSPSQTVVPCYCGTNGVSSTCMCEADGTMDACAFVLACQPPGSATSCCCPTNGMCGNCMCSPDGVIEDQCAFVDAGMGW